MCVCVCVFLSHWYDSAGFEPKTLHIQGGCLNYYAMNVGSTEIINSVLLTLRSFSRT